MPRRTAVPRRHPPATAGTKSSSSKAVEARSARPVAESNAASGMASNAPTRASGPSDGTPSIATDVTI